MPPPFLMPSDSCHGILFLLRHLEQKQAEFSALHGLALIVGQQRLLALWGRSVWPVVFFE